MYPDAACNALIEKQQPEGRRGWLIFEPSDTLETEMAIYALRSHDTEKNQAAILRAVAFLVTNQSSDVSRKVPSTKKITRKNPTPASNYRGEALAIIGLLN